MQKNVDLLNGPVLPSLTRLALPIMATSLVQMAYNMTDMIWIGRAGSSAVAAVGAAGMYMWLSNGLASLTKMGAQVNAGYALGAGDSQKAARFAAGSLQLAALLGIIYGFICVFFSTPLIRFFKLNSPRVISDAKIYLMITCGCVIFSLLNQTFTGILTAAGNSRASFTATSIGLAVNIILDPLLIFGPGPFPALGVAGAAIATIIAQFIVMLMFFYYASKDTVIFKQIHILRMPELKEMKSLVKIGLPTAVQNMIFTAISMLIARLVAGYGDAAIAVQKVGSQIESISWMTADGFAASVNAFLAQNHGAGNHDRIRKGYRSSMVIVLIWGTFCTLLLICCPEPIFRFFIPEARILPMGIDYLKILGVSQLFMCIEITTAGAFAGLGRTLPPSVTGIVLTAARIPLAMILTQTFLGLNGIWWSITISSIFKGIVLLLWFLGFLKNQAPSPQNHSHYGTGGTTRT